jgi:hypothetical protein
MLRPARIDRVDANPVASPLNRKVARHHVDAPLRDRHTDEFGVANKA